MSKVKVKVIEETYGDKLEQKINDFVKGKWVYDIKISQASSEGEWSTMALITYHDTEWEDK